MENKMTFEQAMKRLEEINGQLQKNECPLDDAIELYKEGLKLAQLCLDKLNSLSKQLEDISEDKENDK